MWLEGLHKLLHSAGVPPPYILVGHSMAAYDIRLYISLFKDDVPELCS
jgi:triacylglycerol esterase/lipase EstA (alpha/beta hydrolase family)